MSNNSPELFNPSFKISWLPGKGLPLKKPQFISKAAVPTKAALIGIRATDIQINTTLFSNSAAKAAKEAILTVDFPGDIAPQSTTFPFLGASSSSKNMVTIDPKYLDKLVYFGTLDPTNKIGVSVSLIESNDDIRHALQDAQTVFSDVGGIVPSSLPIPVGPILTLVGSILGLIRDNITDQLETYGATIGKLQNPFTIVVCKTTAQTIKVPDPTTTLLQITFAVRPILPIAKQNTDPKGGDKFRVMISELSFEFANPQDTTIYPVNESTKPGAGTTVTHSTKGTTLPDFISSNNLSTLNIEATSGKQAFSVSSALTTGDEPILSRFDLDKKVLFTTELTQAAIPLALSVSLNPPKYQTSDLVKTAQNAAAVAKAFDKSTPDAVQKAIPSALGLLSELRSTDLSLMSFNGVLIPQAPPPPTIKKTKKAADAPAPEPGYLDLVPDGAAGNDINNTWSGTLQRPVTYGKDSAGKPVVVGTFSVKITVFRASASPSPASIET